MKLVALYAQQGQQEQVDLYALLAKQAKPLVKDRGLIGR
jgi:hypothetical protein